MCDVTQVGDLQLNQEMSKIADSWAQHLAQIKTLQRSGLTYKDQKLGENLAYKFSSKKEPYTGLLHRVSDKSGPLLFLR